jgi:pimeloyl-ACP methyl ester carboxylesterase
VRATRFAIAIAGLAAFGGCGARLAELPPPGVCGPLSFIVTEKSAGPIVLIFPGRSAPTDDVTLGIRQTALRVAEKVDGSVALMSWKVYDKARDWIERQAAARRSRGERSRLALVGHSWGGQAAGQMATELLRAGAVDEVSVLVTIDAIRKGYGISIASYLLAVVTLDSVSAMAFTDTPRADGTKLKRHVNYYQLDSPILRACPIESATENHEVWFDYGGEIGHGNLDNYLMELVSEDIRRAFAAGGAP